MQPIEHLHKIVKKIILAPERSFFMLLRIKYLCHEIGFKLFKPISSKIATNHKINSSTTKIELMRHIGSMNVYSDFGGKLHCNKKPLYDLIHDEVAFHLIN